jgi:hypothetical protein
MAHLILKNQFDLTPEGDIVNKAKIGEKGYIENVEYNLVMTKTDEGIIIFWYGEDSNEISLEEYMLYQTV